MGAALSLTACGNADISAQSRADATKVEAETMPGDVTPQSAAHQTKEADMADDQAFTDTLPSCDILRSKYTGADKRAALMEAFNSEYPAVWVNEKAVEKAAISDSKMGELTAYLSCVAELADYSPEVADAALAMFTSERHGKSAFRALEQQARSTSTDGQAATRFLDQMRDYAEGPQE